MALQRINRVLIRDIRSWRGDHEFTFDEGITVLYGPNGSGKSSLWTGVVLGLLYKISGSVSEVIRPIGGGAGNPYVEIDFIANGIQYRIEKTFGKRAVATARLSNLDSGDQMSEGDAAVIDCRNLLTGSDDQEILGGRGGALNKALEASTKGQIVDLILPKQGQLNVRPEENKSLSSVGLEANAEGQNTALNSMIGWVDEDKKFIKSSDRANASGKLMETIRTHNNVLSEEGRLIELSNDLQTLIQQLNELEIEMGQEEPEVDARQRIDNLRREAENHQLAREVAETDIATNNGVVLPLQTQHTKRTELRLNAETLSTQKAILSGQLTERRTIHERTETDSRKRQENLTIVKSKLVTLNEWITFVQRQGAMVSQKQELAGLKLDQESLDKAIQKAAEIQAELNNIILPTDEQWERIRQIPAEIASIRGAADAWSITQFSPGKNHQIFIDGEKIDKAPDSVNTSIEVRDATGNAKLRVENTISLSEIKELEAEQHSIFSGLSAKGTKELRTRQIRHDELIGKLTVENSRIEDLNKRKAMDGRKEQIAHLTALLDSALDEPESERPGEGDWAKMLTPLEGERNSAELLMNESTTALQTARDNLTETTTQEVVIDGQIRQKEEEISVHIEAFGADDALQTQLAEASVRLQEAQKVAEPLIDTRNANEEQKRSMAQNLQNRMAGEQNTRTRIIELQATIRDRRTTGGLGELNTVSAQCRTLNNEINRLEGNYLALESLELALNTVRTANIEAIRPRVENTIQNGATYVFNREVEVNLGDDGFPQAVQHIQGRAIPFEQESYGTQEQLNLIYRIALAGIIAEDEGHGLCIVLDDPFGDTDIGRRQRMIEWMGAQVGQANHQLILLTCRGPDFNGFGNHDDIRTH